MRLQPLIACLVRSNYIWINLATRNLPLLTDCIGIQVFGFQVLGDGHSLFGMTHPPRDP